MTTFNSAAHNINEALLFKKFGVEKRLLGSDRCDDLSQEFAQGGKYRDLLQTKDKAGVHLFEHPDHGRAFELLSLARTSGTGWRRLVANHKETLEAWLKDLYSRPVHCWVVGGHHHYNHSYAPMCWGSHFEGGEYRPFTGFGVSKTKDLEWFGYVPPSRGETGITRITLVGAKDNLASTALMLVLGCNGIPVHAPTGSEWDFPMAQQWRRWLTGTVDKGPLLLGWYNTQRMPLNVTAEHAAKFFWETMATLKVDKGLGNDNDALPKLCSQHALDVVNAWGSACYKAFHASKTRKRLWYEKLAIKGGEIQRGAGAVTRDGTVYHANPSYKGTTEAGPVMNKVEHLLV